MCNVQGEAINMQLESKNKNAVHLNLLELLILCSIALFFLLLDGFQLFLIIINLLVQFHIPSFRERATDEMTPSF